MADTAPPLEFFWDGEAMHPRRAALADRYFVVGETYRLVEHLERSDLTHRHEFAWIREAWKNLPEGLADEYPTPDHLRKRALISGGWYDEQIIDAGTNAAALRVAQGVRSFPGEDFSVVYVRGAFVVVRRAKSQSKRAMGAKDFQASKQKILEVVSELIGADPGRLLNESGRAA